MVFILVLLCCSIPIPVWLFHQGQKPARKTWSCTSPAQPYSFLYPPGAALRIVPDRNEPNSIRVPEIQSTTLQLWVARTTLRSDIDLLKPEHSFFYTFDTHSGAQLRPVVPSSLLPASPAHSAILNACGLRGSDFSINPVFHVDSLFQN